MYTTIIHPLRKAYCLSINEYCVLEAIRGLSNNTKYGGWSIMSISSIAGCLDLSVDTVRRALVKLESIELITRRKQTKQDTATRATDEWCEWFMADKADILLSMKTTDTQITSIQPKNKEVELATTGSNLLGGVVAICKEGGSNLLDNTNIDTYIDTTVSKDTVCEASPPEKQTTENNNSQQPPIGNKNETPDKRDPRINAMLASLKKRIGIDDFADAQKWARIYARHMVALMEKLGKDEFVRRLDLILADNFKRSNCNKIRFVYLNIKGFVLPKKISYQ